MTVETPVRLMTADELLAMPDDGMRHELVRGELVAIAPAGAGHGDIAGRIAGYLGPFIRDRKLGRMYIADTGFVLSEHPDTVRAPDIAFVRADRVVRNAKYVPGAPDLAVEVISPNDTYSDVDAKVNEYIAAGALMVIVINPRNQTATVTTPKGVKRLTIDDTLDGGDVLPGWTLPMRELFED